LGCQSSRIRHGSIGSVRTHTTVTRAANPTTSSKETIQPPLGTAPPVNLDIDPSGSIALIADSINVIKDGENVKQVPDDKVHVIDLKANPPKAIGTITSHMLPVPTLLAFPAYFRTQSPTTPVAVPHLAPPGP